MEQRLPHNLNVRVDDVHGESLLKAIAADVAVSSGAACATASAEPSHVLRALGLTDDQARASLRFGLGRFTTEQEIDAAATVVTATVRQAAAKPRPGFDYYVHIGQNGDMAKVSGKSRPAADQNRADGDGHRSQDALWAVAGSARFVARSVVITKHDTPKAVLLSMAEFEALGGSRPPDLNALSGEFDGLACPVADASAAGRH